MKVGAKIGVVVLSALVPVVGVSNSTTAQASRSILRTKIVKTSAKPYYSANAKGKTYKFKGSARHLVLKSNHALKNYKSTTWTRTKKTTITKHGKKYLYYYVTNSKNGAKGWVWHKYLKAGKNYQSSKVTSFNGTYQVKKIGKFYKVTGSTKYIKLSQGIKLASNVKYTVNQKRTIYKKGKAYKYYYVTNPGTKQQGWVWHGYLKSGKYTASKDAANNQSVSNQGSSSASTGNTAFNTNAVASNVISILNSERSAAGRAGVVTDGTLNTIGNIRAQQLVTDFSHNYRGIVNESAVLAKQYGIYNSYYATEDLIVVPINTTNAITAKDIVDSFDTAHRDNIMNASFSRIGVGLYKDPNADNTLYVAIQLGF